MNFLRLRFFARQQAWGTETTETYRPTARFPTRSGLTGLLGAALGIDRTDRDGILRLDASYVYAARCEKSKELLVPSRYGKGVRPLTPGRIRVDYQTARGVRRAVYTAEENTDETEQSWREYLEDQMFHLVLMERENAEFSLESLYKAIRNPYYTLYFGRRSCLPAESILVDAGGLYEAESFGDAVCSFDTKGGETVWSDIELLPAERFGKSSKHMIRDVPMHINRLFASRIVHVHTMVATERKTKPEEAMVLEESA